MQLPVFFCAHCIHLTSSPPPLPLLLLTPNVRRATFGLFFASIIVFDKIKRDHANHISLRGLPFEEKKEEKEAYFARLNGRQNTDNW